MPAANSILHGLQSRDRGLICVGEELENFMRTNKQTDREQTDREFNYRGHSNPRGLSG